MNAEALALIRLQETDDQLGLAKKALAESAARLASGRAGLAEAEKALAAERRRQGAEEARHRELEGELADLSARKLKNENRLTAFKSEGEYAALSKEAEFLARKIDELEDETLALLDRLERRAAEIGALAEAASEAGRAFEILAAATAAEEKSLAARLAELSARRADLARSVPGELLKRYEEAARTKGGLAVTPAADGLCLACRLSFPPQFYNDLRRNENIAACPNCGRFIYWRDHPDFQPRPAAP